ncbi:MAG: hypothetical protein ACO1NZ_18625 [Adhaeribacter sp.]
MALPVFSQSSTKRCRWIKITGLPFTLDSLTVVPGTISFSGATAALPPHAYDPATNQFRFLLPARNPAAGPQAKPAADSLLRPSFADTLLSSPADDTLLSSPAGDSLLPRPAGSGQAVQGAAPDSVLLCYRVLPLNLALARYKRRATALDSLAWPGTMNRLPQAAPKEELFRTPGLQKTGNVTRGVSVGNRQNVFVNSALNLQLEGKLSDEIDITAAITDQNIPFQPEGNTQQLQEFDKVFIALQHRRWSLTGGDVVLQNKPAYFLRFYKNVQGGALQVNQGLGTPKAASTTLAASVAKGKFASLTVAAVEGVQGPYRLSGPNGEKFIIVLANSEKIYLDGKLLSRGYDFDYVIDYNQAEITFTARRLITRYSRIRVDFEYSDRNYNRSVYHASHYQDLNKLHLAFNLYREADNPNNLLALDLNNDEKQLLQAVGDSLQQAFTSGAETSRYDRELVLYTDSTFTVDGLPQTAYVYTQDSTLTRYYTVRFTDVGAGQGDYVAESSSVNGRIYRYVAPRDGRRQGRFAPVRILPTPRKKQVATLGARYDVDKQTTVFLETAASEHDLNRFSQKDGADDSGRALRLGYEINDKPLAFLKDYKLRSSLSYEYTDANFEPIDRFRDVDFNRDWSLPVSTPTRVNDNILDFALGLHKNEDNALHYRISRRYRRQEAEGTQHYLDLARQLRGFQLKSSFFLLQTAARQSQSNWARGQADLSYPAFRVVPGYLYRFDKNRVSSRLRPDSLLASAMYYDEHTLYVRSQDTAATRFSLAYTFRQDRPPGEGQLAPRQNARQYQGTLQTKLGKEQDLHFIGTYRQVQGPDSAAEATILSTVRWLGTFLDRHLRSELDYTVGTGREPRRVYEFVEVAPGQGTHYLLDGGDPRNLNDYFEAQVPDARYRTHIKVFLPTDQYVTAYMNQFSYRLNSSMPRNWGNKEGLLQLASRLSALTSVSINKKNSDDNVWRRFNPFSLEVDDDLLISMSNAFRNTVFYNRSDPAFGMEYTVQENTQKLLLANGTDVRVVGSDMLTMRYNFSQLLSARLSGSRFRRESRSSYLSTKNFRIRGHELAPEFSFQPGNALRFTGSYLYTFKENRGGADVGEQARFHELGVETRLSQVGKRTLSNTLRYIRVAYQGDENAPLAFEMLNALRPGNNLTWNVVLQQKLSNGLNVSLNYDGRKPQGLGMIHSGRMQVSVLF